MSSAGAGVVVLAAAPVIAVVGAGILIGKAVIWCGEKLEENYQGACKEWTNLADKARAENMQNAQEMGSYLADQVDCMVASKYLAVNTSNSSPATATVDTQALNEAFARTQQTLADAQELVQSRTDTQETLLAYRLRAEIAAGRGILAPKIIQQAENALNSSPAAMQQALVQLQAAWGSITEADSLRKRNTYQAQQILQAVRAQLSAIDALLPDVKSSARLTLPSQQDAIEMQVREAETFLDVHPPTALARARAVEQEARRLMEMISAEIVTTWSNRRKETNILRGMLNSLDTMLREASSIKLIDASQVHDLTERIQKTQTNLVTLEQDSSPAASQRLARVKSRVELLKQEVFTVIRTTQQRSAAQTIAATLTELGFQASGNQPIIQQHGDVIHIQAMINQGKSLAERDEKIVSFDITEVGNVSYDFSGYVGDSCIHDAQRIFAILSKKGLCILDEQGSKNLQHLPSESITLETLQSPQFLPNVVRNKTQAELAESLKRVLATMGYGTIQQRTVGGSIELEAFQGQIGYRVVLSPEGEARILKDAQRTDVSNDARDPVANAAQSTIQQAQLAENVEDENVEEEHRSSSTFLQKKRRISG